MVQYKFLSIWTLLTFKWAETLKVWMTLWHCTALCKVIQSSCKSLLYFWKGVWSAKCCPFIYSSSWRIQTTRCVCILGLVRGLDLIWTIMSTWIVTHMHGNLAAAYVSLYCIWENSGLKLHQCQEYALCGLWALKKFQDHEWKCLSLKYTTCLPSSVTN